MPRSRETTDASAAAATPGGVARGPDVTIPLLPDGTEQLGPDSGRILDRYVVVEEIGAGGMGRVFRAYDPRLEREVALKLVHHGREVDAETSVRMLREAQSMAQLSHPNVVPVYDVKEADGQIFMAMEYVRGQTLTQWLRTEKPAWRAALRVMREAGRGLAAAHAAGLVHRDFKPHNVMLGRDGRVKVMDFGLARGTDGGPSSSDTGEFAGSADLGGDLTTAGTVVGTPAYMSPEQHTGKIADPRSDQFAFCVALHEAVYGERPFEAPTVDALCEAKLEGRFVAPSTEHVPAWLRDVIDRGLSPAPADRFASMGELLSKIDRHEGSSKAPWIIAGLVLTGGVVAWGLASGPAEGQCQAGAERLASVWDDGRRAEIEGAFEQTGLPYATTTSRIVVKRLDDYADSWRQGYEDVCRASREGRGPPNNLMDLQFACLERARLQLQATVEVLRADVDEQTVRNGVAAVGDLRGLQDCRDAATLQAGVAAPASESVARAVADARTQLATAAALQAAGKVAQALVISREAAVAASELGYEPLAIELDLQLGSALGAAGDHEEARSAFESAFYGALSIGDDEATSKAATAMLGVAFAMADREEGRRWQRRAAAWVQRVGQGGTMEARFLEQEALLLQLEGEFKAATANFERALAIVEDQPDVDKLWAASLLDGLGVLATRDGRFDGARQYLERAHALARDVYGDDHPGVAEALQGLGRVHEKLAQYDRAIELHDQAIAVMERALGPDHLSVAGGLDLRGSAHYARGNYDRATADHERALAVRRAALGPDHPQTAGTLNNLAMIAGERGDHEQARDHYQSVLDIMRSALAPGHPHIGVAHNNLGTALEDLEQYAEAKSHHERALAIWTEAHGPEHHLVAMSHHNLGRLALARGDHRRALAHHERALEIREAVFGKEHSDTATTVLHLGKVYQAMGDAPGARELYERCLAVREKVLGPDHHKIAEVRFALARILGPHERGRALALARKAIQAYADAGRGFEARRLEVARWVTARRAQAQ